MTTMFFSFRLSKHQIKTLGREVFFFFLTRTQTSFRNHLGHKDFFSTVEVLKSPFRQKKKKQKLLSIVFITIFFLNEQ
jgi:hypothetical protein